MLKIQRGLYIYVTEPMGGNGGDMLPYHPYLSILPNLSHLSTPPLHHQLTPHHIVPNLTDVTNNTYVAV